MIKPSGCIFFELQWLNLINLRIYYEQEDWICCHKVLCTAFINTRVIMPCFDLSTFIFSILAGYYSLSIIKSRRIAEASLFSLRTGHNLSSLSDVEHIPPIFPHFLENGGQWSHTTCGYLFTHLPPFSIKYLLVLT